MFLHVPSFHFNLINLSTLLHDNDCSAHNCFLQACSQDLMIRMCDLYLCSVKIGHNEIKRQKTSKETFCLKKINKIQKNR